MNIQLSIVIPVFNEEKNIGKNLQIIKKYLDQQNLSYEIIVSNDGSTDRTEAEISNSGVEVFLITSTPNLGKGSAIKNGMLQAKGEIVVFMDADLATPITELPKILTPLQKNKTDIAIGSRTIGKEDVKRSIWRAILGFGFRQLKTFISGLDISDSQCGFKGFQKHTIQPIFSRQTINGWSFDVEILTIAKKLSYRILEVPVIWTEQGNSKMKLWQAVPKMFWELIKIRLKA